MAAGRHACPTQPYLQNAECKFEADHRERWQECGIPDEVGFHTEPELALEMAPDLVKGGVIDFQWVACDEHFGENPAFLDGITALGKDYMAEVPCSTRVWLRTPRVEPPGPGLLGRPRRRPRVAKNAPRPRELREIAARLPQSAWKCCTFKEGRKGPMVGEVAFLRVTAIRERLPGPRLWAVFGRSLGELAELKFYLSNAPVGCPRRELAELAGMRWPIDTTLEEGKSEVGMDHYETRTWRGWYHHMAQTFMAHHFLMRLRVKFKKNYRCKSRSKS